MGVWLPLALVETVSWLKVLVRMFGDERTRQNVKIGETSEKLREWCLPLMAAAMEADEKRGREARRMAARESMMDNLKSLAQRFGATVKVN